MTPSGPIPAAPRRALTDQIFDLALWGGLATLLVIGFSAAEIHKLPLLFSNSENMRQFGKDFLRPDFSEWKLYIGQMWLTIQMALWGTFLAVMLAIPLGLAAAKNISPAWVSQPLRRVLDLLRSVPDLVMGTLFIVAEIGRAHV